MRKIALLLLAIVLSAGIVWASTGELPGDIADEPTWLPELEQFQFPELEESFPSTEVPWDNDTVTLRELMLNPSRALEMLNPANIWQWLVDRFWRNLLAERGFLLQLIALGVFSGVLRLFGDALQSQQLQRSLQWMLSLLFFTVLILRLKTIIQITQQTVDQLSGVMVSMLPGITFYWTAAASLSNLALFKPVVIGSIQLAAQLASNWILPALITSSLLTLASIFSQPVDLTRLAKLIRSSGVAVLASAMLVIVGLTTVQGKLSAAADGALIAGGKYLIKNTLPIIGSAAADALEMTAGTTLLLGQAVGWLGTLTIIAALINPCLQLLLSAVLLKIGAAGLAPFAEARFVDSIDALGDAVLHFFALVLMMGIFFYIMLTTLVSLQDISLLLRI